MGIQMDTIITISEQVVKQDRKKGESSFCPSPLVIPVESMMKKLLLSGNSLPGSEVFNQNLTLIHDLLKCRIRTTIFFFHMGFHLLQIIHMLCPCELVCYVRTGYCMLNCIFTCFSYVITSQSHYHVKYM